MKSPKNLKIIFQIRFGRRTFLNLATSEVHSFWFAPAGLTFSRKAGSWMFVAGVLMFRLSVIHYFQDKPEEDKEGKYSPCSIRNNATIKRVCQRKRR